MKFKVENGSNHISIGLSDIGSYFRFDNPLSLVWYDNRGSIGKYFCLLPYNKIYRDELENKLLANLNKDFSNNIEELYTLLGPLFSLFKNGEYSLNFSKENIFQCQTSRDNYAEIHYYPLELAFTEATAIDNLEDIKRKHQTFLKENAITKKFYACDILDYTTYNLYVASHCFFATQPDTCIAHNRVNYFEKQIAAGERPFVVIMQASCYQLDLHSSYFIIDGHHKLLAYQKLGIYPSMALITHLPASADEIEFDAEKLSTLLYPWQFEDLLENWDEKDTYVFEKLKNANSPLHQFIKNGLVKEYHPNKKPKHEAFYINDKVDGKSLEWYDNGQLKHEHHFSHGKKIGIWKEYFFSGQLKSVYGYDDNWQIHGKSVSYFENGSQRSEYLFENGKYADGYGFTRWGHTQNMEFEFWYENNIIKKKKSYNDCGQLVSSEYYDKEQRKLLRETIANTTYYKERIISSTVTSDKNLNILREKQYPQISYKVTWRWVAILLLLLLQLLRMCH